MAKNINKVVAGDYIKFDVVLSFGKVSIKRGFKSILINKESVQEYEVANQDLTKSASSGLLRGLVGGAAGSLVAGPIGVVGAAAGLLSAKNKKEITIAIQFKDGKKSLLKVDNKVYEALVKNLF